MVERQQYRGKVIEARSNKLRGGLGWDAAFCVEETDGSSIMFTPFSLPDVFLTEKEAIGAALQAGRKQIDAGFVRRFVIEPESNPENSLGH
jgi:hypothetical protein